MRNLSLSIKPTQVTLVAVLMVLVHIAFRGWAAYGSWFVSDDFVFLTAAALDEADAKWIFDRHNRHLIPLGRWQGTLVGNSAVPFNWDLAWAQILFWTAASSLAAWFMLRVLFGNRLGILIPLGFYLFGNMAFGQSLWWSGAIIRMPMSTAMFLSIGFLVMYLRSKKWLYLLLFILANLFGLASYMNMVLLASVFGLIALFYFTEGKVLQRLGSAVKNYWPALVALIAMNGAYLYYFLTYRSELVPEVRPEAILETLDYFVFANAMPSIVGGPMRWQETPPFAADPPLIMMGLGVLVTVLFLINRYRNYTYVTPAIVINFQYWLLVGFTVAWGTGGHWGAYYAGHEPRYLADVAVVITLCLGLLLMPIIGAPSQLTPRQESKPISTQNRRLLVIAGSFFIFAGTYSSITYAQSWNSTIRNTSYTFVRNAELSIHGIKSNVAETFVPETVQSALFYPDNKLSRFLAPIGANEVAVFSGNDLSMLDEEGNLVKAAVLEEPTHAPGGIAGCGYLVNENPVKLSIEPTAYLGSWLAIGYLSGDAGSLTVTGEGFWRRIEVEKGLHTGFIFVNKRIENIQLHASDGTVLCVDAVRNGPLFPVE